MKSREVREARRSIKLLFIESALTRASFILPVVYLLWTNDLGMSQWQIGLLQAIFAATMLLLQFPTGYFADRISHKLSNSVGDFMLVGGMAVYFFAGNFWVAVVAEVLLGMGYSFSGGADSALLKAHAKTADLDYKKLNSRMVSWRLLSAAITSVAGGWLGTVGPRLPFAVEGVVMLLALTISFFIKDSGVRHVTHERAWRGMFKVAHQLSTNRVLLRRMLLGAALLSSTMMSVWFFTPMFFEVGIDLKWQGWLYAAISFVAILGSEFASKKVGKSWRLSFPLLIVSVSYLFLGLTMSIWTFWVFLFSSFVRGINSAKVSPAIQDVAPHGLEASALSLHNVFYRFFVIFSMLTVNWAGNIRLNYGFISAGVLCLAFWLIFYFWKE